MEELLDDIQEKSEKALINKSQDEQEVIEFITLRVEELLDRSPELLFSWMYRLDVYEEKIQKVIKVPSPTPIADALANLIWERQKQRFATKIKYSSRKEE